MRTSITLKISIALLLAAGAAAWIVGAVVSCGTAPTPFVIRGPGRIGNEPPTLTFLEPTSNITVSQGERFLIRWTDTDRDDNAAISFSLVNVTSNAEIVLVKDIDENDTIGPDSFTVSTALLPKGTYHVLGTIDDSQNPAVEDYAMVAGATVRQRVIVTVVGPGEGPQTKPPTITVTEPSYNLSVTQDDVLRVTVQPTALAPDPNNPYDPDSRVTLYILLDVDQDPNNDEPANPDPSKIVLLRESSIAAGDSAAIPFDIIIDLAVVPPRPAGEPYYVRATVYDATNPPVHSYAPGTIGVVRLAEGEVDLFDIGRTKSGARFYGFNPGAYLGSSLSHVGDFDADGVDDFVLVARFGNPQNAGPVGEAYLIYGQGRQLVSLLVGAGNRFGGAISANGIGDTISGVVFHAPPVRVYDWDATDPPPRTEGITDVSFVRDLTGDGRPDLLFGLPHVHHAFDSTDYDPEDSDPQDLPGCYPDDIVNNLADSEIVDPYDIQFYAGGMAVIVNSQNRDSSGTRNPARLESTVVNLELVGQRRFVLNIGGLSDSGSIFPRAENAGVDPLGNDPDEEGRIAGARVIAGGYDWIAASYSGFGFDILYQPPREGLFGQTVRSLGDLNADGLDELIISAPRNERYLEDLWTTYGWSSTHWTSKVYEGSIAVLPGRNYNQVIWRDMAGEDGTSRIPWLPREGRCTGQIRARRYWIPADEFEIYAENIDDMLGGGRSAGDFNQDGIDDILCAAPLNDRTEAIADSGAAYVIYGRTVFGEVRLFDADDQIHRPPMLRIRGLKVGDQTGWRATAGLDVNGDRIDDVFVASPLTDFGPVVRTTCGTDFNRDGAISQADFILRSFNTCQETVDKDKEVFSDDSCKAFDYDNDGDIDDDDRCVFCCLSDDCDPAETCLFGRGTSCCENLVDNGFVGIVFGGVFIDGDRDISQLAASQLPGTVFYGDAAGHRAGYDVSSAGDFNQDGFGDILISAPGEVRQDSAGRERLGVVYLIFGGTHLINTTWSLRDVGSDALPGIVFISPYVRGRPNEAAPTTVGFIGDINKDGFGDIAIGSPKADFIDLSFPQGPEAPGSDAAVGRRRDVGDVYVVYGNNFGRNRGSP